MAGRKGRGKQQEESDRVGNQQQVEWSIELEYFHILLGELRLYFDQT